MADSGGEESHSTVSDKDTPSSVSEEASLSPDATEGDSIVNILAEIDSALVDPVRMTPIEAETALPIPKRASTGLNRTPSSGTSTPTRLRDTMGAVGGSISTDLGHEVSQAAHDVVESSRIIEEATVWSTPAAAHPFTSVAMTSEGSIEVSNTTVGDSGTVGDGSGVGDTVRPSQSVAGADQSTAAVDQSIHEGP